MHVRGDYSNAMLLMTPWESVHLAHKTLSWWESDNMLVWSEAQEGWEQYEQRLHCIKCDDGSVVCPNLMCMSCCEQEGCDCPLIQWKQNPTKTTDAQGQSCVSFSPVLWLDTVRGSPVNDKCKQLGTICPNGWSLVDRAESC